MKGTLSAYRVSGVWHFTDQSNLQSIIDHGGLLSLSETRRRGIRIPAAGGNQWSHDADGYKGVDEYVHLSFLDDHPMLFRAKEAERITNAVWLKISLDVLDIQGVRYTADVSNKAGIPLLTADQAREQLDLEVMFTRTDWKDPEIRERRKLALKSEVLIPNFIPIELILGKKHG